MVYQHDKRTPDTIRGDIMGAFIKMRPGEIYGHWEVLSFDRIDSHTDARWKCKCLLCGEVHSVRGFSLRNKTTHSCKQCANKRRVTRG